METYAKLISLIILLSILSMIGYRIISPPKTPLDLLEEIYKKAAKAERYNITYSLEMTMEFADISFTGKGNANVAFVKNNSKTTVSLTLPGIIGSSESTQLTEIYTLPEGEMISCERPYPTLYPEKYECKEIEPSPIPLETTSMSPETQMIQLKEWKDKKILNVSYLGTKKVIERNCYNFRFDVDLNKIMENMTGFSFKEGQTNYTFFTCFDQEIGISLEAYMELIIKIEDFRFPLGLEYEKSSTLISMKVLFEATNLNFNVDESAIKLPVPEDKVYWLPKFKVLESNCEPNSNTVKLAIKARKDIQAGKANLNVSWSEYELTKYKYYNLTAETDFPRLKKDEIAILNFTLPSPLKEDKSFTINLKIDGMEYTGYCSTYRRVEGTGWPFTGFFPKILEKIRNVTASD